MHASGVAAQQFARQTLAYLAGPVGATTCPVQYIVKLSVKGPAHVKWAGGGPFAVDVGAA